MGTSICALCGEPSTVLVSLTWLWDVLVPGQADDARERALGALPRTDGADDVSVRRMTAEEKTAPRVPVKWCLDCHEKHERERGRVPRRRKAAR